MYYVHADSVAESFHMLKKILDLPDRDRAVEMLCWAAQSRGLHEARMHGRAVLAGWIPCESLLVKLSVKHVKSLTGKLQSQVKAYLSKGRTPNAGDMIEGLSNVELIDQGLETLVRDGLRARDRVVHRMDEHSREAYSNVLEAFGQLFEAAYDIAINAPSGPLTFRGLDPPDIGNKRWASR